MIRRKYEIWLVNRSRTISIFIFNWMVFDICWGINVFAFAVHIRWKFRFAAIVSEAKYRDTFCTYHKLVIIPWTKHVAINLLEFVFRTKRWKPLSQPMVVNLLKHIYGIRPKWEAIERLNIKTNAISEPLILKPRFGDYVLLKRKHMQLIRMERASASRILIRMYCVSCRQMTQNKGVS